MLQYPFMQLPLLIVSHVRRWKESQVVCTCNLRNRNRCGLCSFPAGREAVRRSQSCLSKSWCVLRTRNLPDCISLTICGINDKLQQATERHRADS